MFNKLKKRIKSLEEHLGVAHSVDGMYSDHNDTKYGTLSRIDERLQRLEKLSKIDSNGIKVKDD